MFLEMEICLRANEYLLLPIPIEFNTTINLLLESYELLKCEMNSSDLYQMHNITLMQNISLQGIDYNHILKI